MNRRRGREEGGGEMEEEEGGEMNEEMEETEAENH